MDGSSAPPRGGLEPKAQSERPRRALDREIWAMAWPAMLSLLVVNVVDVVDVALVGRLGRQTVAAWGYSVQAVHLVELLVQSVGIGCVALMSRSVGARDSRRARGLLLASVLVAIAVAAVGFVVVGVFPRELLRLLDAHPAVIEIAVPYFRLSAFSMLLFGGAFMFESGLRAHRNTRGPMFVAMAVMTTKTVLSLGLIFGLFGLPRLELVGAGLATVGAHAVGLVAYVGLCRAASRDGMAVTFGRADLPEARRVLREVLRVSAPAMAERFVLSLALLTYFKILSGYGTAAIAAYAIGVRLLSFSWVPGLGFATAASTVVGQALGAGDGEHARRAGWRAVSQAVLVMCGIGSVFLVFERPLAFAFTSDQDVAVILVPFMTMLALAQPFMGAHFTLGGVLRGSGDTVTPFLGALVGNWGFRVPLAWLFARLGYELTWVWAVLICDHIARMVINGGVFLRGRWTERTGASLRAAPTEGA